MAVDGSTRRTLGRYVIESAIGAGGFATVYRAVDTVLERPVAIKVLDPRPHRDSTIARRFLLEGRAVASLDHPAIVPVYDAGEDDGLLWMAMRLVEGRSLAEALEAGDRFTGDQVGALLDRIGPALDHAHAHGIVHRDVKPSNILLEGGGPARAWLADFGIAATARTAGRYTSGTLGTVAYMAPEQVRPSEARPPADVYSLGCVAYELVTGCRPFPGDDHVALLMAHATQPVPPTGDAGLDRVLVRALAKAPADRPSSGAALAAELRAALRTTGGAASTRTAAHDAPTVVTASAAAAPPAPPGRADPTLVAPGSTPRPAPPGRADPTLVAPGSTPRPPPPPRPRPAAGPPVPRGRAGPPAPPPAPGRPAAPSRLRRHDPTVARRGLSRARRNVLVGAAALAIGAGALLAATRGGGGQVERCDSAGVCFAVPGGWSVGEVQQGRVTLERGGVVAATYRHQPAEPGDAVATLGAMPSLCTGEAESVGVGDAAGARCPTAGGGTAAAVFDSGLLWVITVESGVPDDEAEDFVASLEFGPVQPAQDAG